MVARIARAAVGVCVLGLCAAPAAARSEPPGLLTEHGKLVPQGSAISARFGSALALETPWLAVGVPGGIDARVEVFRRDEGEWKEESVLRPEAPTPADQFGSALDLEDGRLAVGAFLGDDAASNAGAVHLFTVGASGFSPAGVLLASDGEPDDEFGFALDLDGERLAIGAPFEDDGGESAGAVYVFRESPLGWYEEAKLVLPGGAGLRLGWSVALRDGCLLAGAPGHDGGGPDSGAVFVFTLQGTLWQHADTLSAAAPQEGAMFGTSIAVCQNFAAIGAPFESIADVSSGGVHLFHRDGFTLTPWMRLTAPTADHGERFGRSVALRADRLLVGAPGSNSATPGAGAAWIFLASGDGMVPWREFHASDAQANDQFGTAVAFDCEAFAVGAPLEDSLSLASGAVYTFALLDLASFCFGDGTGAICPCGNTGPPGAGCANSSGTGGLLLASGTTDPDTVLLETSGVPARQPVLFLQGSDTVASGAGAAFGDGLRCVGGTLVRLGVRRADARGHARYGPDLGDPALSFRAGVVPGSGATLRYQAWYRDPADHPCGTPFNITQAIEIVW